MMNAAGKGCAAAKGGANTKGCAGKTGPVVKGNRVNCGAELGVFTGVLEKYDTLRGFGFIESPQLRQICQKQGFVHGSELGSQFSVGDRVSFRAFHSLKGGSPVCVEVEAEAEPAAPVTVPARTGVQPPQQPQQPQQPPQQTYDTDGYDEEAYYQDEMMQGMEEEDMEADTLAQTAQLAAEAARQAALMEQQASPSPPASSSPWDVMDRIAEKTKQWNSRADQQAAAAAQSHGPQGDSHWDDGFDEQGAEDAMLREQEAELQCMTELGGAGGDTWDSWGSADGAGGEEADDYDQAVAAGEDAWDSWDGEVQDAVPPAHPPAPQALGRASMSRPALQLGRSAPGATRSNPNFPLRAGPVTTAGPARQDPPTTSLRDEWFDDDDGMDEGYPASDPNPPSIGGASHASYLGGVPSTQRQSTTSPAALQAARARLGVGQPQLRPAMRPQGMVGGRGGTPRAPMRPNAGVPGGMGRPYPGAQGAAGVRPGGAGGVRPFAAAGGRAGPGIGQAGGRLSGVRPPSMLR